MRFLWMLTNAEVPDDLLDKFGAFGLTSLVKFRYIAKDEDKLRAFFKKRPFELDDEDVPIIRVRVDGLGMRWRGVQLNIRMRQVRSQ